MSVNAVFRGVHAIMVRAGKFLRPQRRHRGWFRAGLVLVLPTAATLVFLKFIMVLINGWAQPIADPLLSLLPESHVARIILWLPGIAVVTVLLMVYLVGGVACTWLGRKLRNLLDAVGPRIPIGGFVYKLVRKGTRNFESTDGKPFFQGVVTVNMMGLVVYALITGEAVSTSGDELYSLYIPVKPNPTGYHLGFCRKDDVTVVDMEVSAVFEWGSSLGQIVPAVVPMPPRTV